MKLFKIAVFCGAVLSVAHADEMDEVLVFNLENDMFTGSDSNYTNGMALTWSSDQLSKYREEHFTYNLANFFSFLPGFNPGGDDSYLSYSFVHDINTASDIDLVDPPLDEQPYSGIFSVGTSFITAKERLIQGWLIRFGAVGPITLAEEIQTEWHRIIDVDLPQGWDTQLPNEPFLNLGYIAGYHLFENKNDGGPRWRFSPLIDLELGNLNTGYTIGAVVEVSSSFDNPISSGVAGIGLGNPVGIGSSISDSWEWSAFIGANTFGIGHAVAVDGTIFRDSRSVGYNHFGYAINGGVTVRKGKLIANFAINYGEPFDNPEDRLSYDFGTIALGWHF